MPVQARHGCSATTAFENSLDLLVGVWIKSSLPSSSRNSEPAFATVFYPDARSCRALFVEGARSATGRFSDTTRALATSNQWVRLLLMPPDVPCLVPLRQLGHILPNFGATSESEA
ncbi:hypothetical protein MPTK1_6g06770 [Marchantia polymorpha subsp. ruderalis]|uniref:Uncharacterized protein n=2 Tax=Marchantia polymorpha TaxID=3197 RepID=A0AAF6BP96_MARPO|nr:hypothetical protein MARPO_0173s0022 [Marchantia polymorpha]BBN13830.1 hypothetical protein Mp_6g06770 [Marchantia polymorpha subsp. ruderalis]|eukprot:PTQ28119.1 hypothetical protein MARPO_0173s0022 [Marchantia polymorpha]